MLFDLSASLIIFGIIS